MPAMAWQETLTALQNGAIEGQENPINVICSYKLWESNQKYATLTRHSYSTAIITMSLAKFNELPEDVQTISKMLRRKLLYMKETGQPKTKPHSCS